MEKTRSTLHRVAGYLILLVQSVPAWTGLMTLPLAAYPGLDGFRKSNDAWIAAAVDLGEQAVRSALDAAGLGPRDVDQLVFVTVTGLATPSIDARLSNRLGLRPDVKRVPVFGLGCGILTIVIRLYAGYPEGVCYAILLMNTCVPLIDAWTRPIKFGAKRPQPAAG